MEEVLEVLLVAELLKVLIQIHPSIMGQVPWQNAEPLLQLKMDWRKGVEDH